MGIGLVLFRCPELPGFRHAQDRSVRRRRPAAARTAPLQAADRHLRWRLRPLPGDRRHGLGKPRRKLQSQLGAVAVFVLPGALQRQAPRRARQRGPHGARELLPQAAGQPQLVLDARGAADPVQRLLLFPRQGGRHRAPGSQPRPAGRRQHRLAAGRGRAQHPDRGGSGSRPGGCRGSGGERNRRADRHPQLREPPLLVRIPGDGRIPSEQRLQAGPGSGPALLQGQALARAAQPARRRLLRLSVGRQRGDQRQAARRQGLLPQRRSHALGRRFRPARGAVRKPDRILEHLGIGNGIQAHRLFPSQGSTASGTGPAGRISLATP